MTTGANCVTAVLVLAKMVVPVALTICVQAGAAALGGVPLLGAVLYQISTVVVVPTVPYKGTKTVSMNNDTLAFILNVTAERPLLVERGGELNNRNCAWAAIDNTKRNKMSIDFFIGRWFKCLLFVGGKVNNQIKFCKIFSSSIRLLSGIFAAYVEQKPVFMLVLVWFFFG